MIYKAAFAVVFGALVAAAVGAGRRLRSRPGGTVSQTAHEVRALKVLRPLLGVVLYAALLDWLVPGTRLPWARLGLAPATRLAGFVVAGAGVALVQAAVRALGRSYRGGVGLWPDHELVTGGPYRWVQHPVYTGFVLITAGAFLLSASWLVGASGILLTVSIPLIRLPIEERELEDRFGAAYTSYRDRTGRFVPRGRRKAAVTPDREAGPAPAAADPREAGAPIRPIGWTELGLLFGGPTLLNLVACRVAIPFLERLRLFPIEISYFLSVGLLVLVPMFLFAIHRAGHEIGSFRVADLLARLRVRSLSPADSAWAVGAFLLLSLASYGIAEGVMPVLGLDATPFFFQNMPVGPDHYAILYAWPAFFFFNIFGEELLWRGYIQPRQERLTGRWTWLVHGLLWAGWHLPMGLDLILAASPILFILPAVVQARKNTTVAIAVHAAFGAFGYLSIALGLAS